MIFSFLLGCGNESGINDPEKRNENWCWFVDENTKEGEWVPLGDKTTLDDGEYTLFFCNGEIRKTGKLKNGEDCDTIFQYSLNGKLISKIFKDKDGDLNEIMPNGKYKDYYPSCELRAEGEIKNNKHVGVRTEYYKNGVIKGLLWQNGDTSLYKSFYETGEKRDSSMSINGKANGLAKYWFKNGQIEAIRYWKNDLRHGDFEFYFENGQIQQKSRYYNDMRQDTVMDWYNNGQLRFVRQYEQDKRVGNITAWFENGNIKATSSFLNDEKHGEYKEYYENGKLLKEGQYNKGQLTGTWKYYNEEGYLTNTKNF